MDSAGFNEFLLRLGISTTGLAFGLCLPILFRLFYKTLWLHRLHPACARHLAGVAITTVAACTVFMVIFKDHVTLRRLFLLTGTTVASIVLWLVRGVGTGDRGK